MVEFNRIKRLPPYVFNTINDLKQEARRRGEDIVDFSMGNPDMATPAPIVEKLVEAVQKPQNHRYSVSRGIYKLRVAISDWYQRRYGVAIDADDEAIVTMGSKEGLAHLVLAMIDPGDVVCARVPPIPSTSTRWSSPAVTCGASHWSPAKDSWNIWRRPSSRHGRGPSC